MTTILNETTLAAIRKAARKISHDAELEQALLDAFEYIAIDTFELARVGYAAGPELDPAAGLGDVVAALEARENYLATTIPRLREEAVRLTTELADAEREAITVAEQLLPVRAALRPGEKTAAPAPVASAPAPAEEGGTTISLTWEPSDTPLTLATEYGISEARVLEEVANFRTACLRAGLRRRKWGKLFGAHLRAQLKTPAPTLPGLETPAAAPSPS